MNKTVRTEKGAAALLLAVMLLAIPVFAASCAFSPISDEEAAQILESKCEKARELAVIVYGEGLPVAAEEEEDEGGGKTAHYVRVDATCGYNTKEDIMRLAEGVFSLDYSEKMWEYAFTGGEEFMPRYGENTAKQLTININSEPMGVLVSVDTASAHVISGSRYSVIVSVDAVRAGADGENVSFTKKVTLIRENSGWVLDSALF